MQIDLVSVFRKLQTEPDWFGCKLVTNDGGDIRVETIIPERRWSMVFY